jgi:hypothetical protein
MLHTASNILSKPVSPILVVSYSLLVIRLTTYSYPLTTISAKVTENSSLKVQEVAHHFAFAQWRKNLP